MNDAPSAADDPARVKPGSETSPGGAGRWRKLLAVLVSLTVSLLVGEVALRFVYGDQYFVWKPGVMTVSKAVPGYMPGVEGEATFVINRFGLRGDPFTEDQQLRILALGGSTTECFYLDEPESWPGVLQDSLSTALGSPVWVGNAGRSGHTSQEHVLQAQKLLGQYPRIDVLLVLVGINDFHQFLARDGSWVPVPPFESLTLKRKEALLHRAFEVVPAGLRHEGKLHTRTATWTLVRRIALELSSSGATHVNHQDAGGSNYYKWRSHRQQASGIRTRLPDLSHVLAEYRENLSEIIAHARNSGVRPILVTQPTLWRADLPRELQDLLLFGGVGDYWGEVGKEYYAVDALAEGMRRFNDTLLQTCTELDVDCIDLAASVPKTGEFFYDDCHFNEAGARFVGSILTNYFVESAGSIER